MLPRTSVFASLLVTVGAFAQTAPDTYWVQFSNKDNTPYSLSQPEQFLSARALARRQAQGTALDELDLPVDPTYIAAVLATGEVELINRSKWFNAITVRTSDADALVAIQQLPFVSNVRDRRSLTGGDPAMDEMLPVPNGEDRGGQPEDYGASWTQISMLNGHLLHAMEAKGQGMLIGVLDSGFDKADSLPAFDSLRAREGILLTRDMANHDGDVYEDHWHGRSVLSCMTGILPGYLQGTAPQADYVLLRTEIVAVAGVDFEFIVEEDNWIAGAELCDSLGCDLITTSLGYTQFDDSLTDHVYADLDGATARISIAAGIATQKGMITVSSAGNSGQNDWHFIGTPADAIDILAVGAVGAQEQHAPFSSWGPSADGRVKPDVCTMGWGAIGLRVEGDSIAPLNGTSFSAPILAGLVACLWQLHPDRTAQEIMHAVRQSASLYFAPNDSMGYGVPNFLQAHNYLVQLAVEEGQLASDVQVFPVPFSDHLCVIVPEAADASAQATLIDPQGRQVLSIPVGITHGRMELDGLGALASGIYLLRIEQASAIVSRRVVKQ